MKVIITQMSMSQGNRSRAFWDPNALGGLGAEVDCPPEITASVILVGDPKEAHSLTGHPNLEIRPAERVEPSPNTLDVAKGDKVQYRFLRGARSGNPAPETSKWMTVIAIDKDKLTVCDKESPGLYEFVILKCQITALEPKKNRKVRISAQERIDVPDLANSSIETDAVTLASVQSTLRVKDGYELVKKDSLSDLRRSVKEFNLE